MGSSASELDRLSISMTFSTIQQCKNSDSGLPNTKALTAAEVFYLDLGAGRKISLGRKSCTH